MLSREDAEHYGQISGAEVGLSRTGGGKTFEDEFFDPKTALYESVELSDLLGTRFLARKIQDVPPRVPPLDEVRKDVALAWKIEKARPLAQKAAEQVAEQLKKLGGPPKEATFQGYRVVTIPAMARKRPAENLNPNPFAPPPPPEEWPISQIPSRARPCARRSSRSSRAPRPSSPTSRRTRTTP